MKTTSLVTALAIAVATPAFAQSAATILAVEHFNQSAESVSDIIDLATITEGAAVSTEDDSALARAMELLGDDNDLGYASVFPSEPAFASGVFDRLASQ